MKNRLTMITREDEELSVFLAKVFGMINMHRTEKRRLFLWRVIDAGRGMLCEIFETHRRGIAH
jgi:hypothetical protein